jgi:hypothetical protein
VATKPIIHAALKLLFKDVDIVKAQAEDVILATGARIGEEIAKVPKATKWTGGNHQFTPQGKLTGRAEATKHFADEGNVFWSRVMPKASARSPTRTSNGARLPTLMMT